MNADRTTHLVANDFVFEEGNGNSEMAGNKSICMRQQSIGCHQWNAGPARIEIKAVVL
jgi:hypothetical protein